MKKIIITILSILTPISILFPTSIKAEEVISCLEERTINGEIGVYYTLAGDTNEYFVVNRNGIICVYNLAENMVIGTATLVRTETFTINAPPLITNSINSNYERWGNYYCIQETTLRIDDISNASLSAIIGYVTGMFNAIGGALAGWITSVAISVYNNKYGNLKSKRYMKSNNYCTILQKHYADIYNNNVKVYTTTEEIYWENTPYDYSEPAACRVLAETYY